MNVLIIPSWYPSERFPLVGIFFKEQARLIAKARPDWNVGISLWGSHEPLLWVHRTKPLDSLLKLGSRPPLKPSDRLLERNCVEFFTPAFTWTRGIMGGNINGITKANLENIRRFEIHFGSIDVIHAHVSYPAGEIARRLSAICSIPFVITEHMSPFPLNSFKRSVRKYLIPPLKAANQVFAVGQTLFEELAKFGVDAMIIKNFIDLERFKPIHEPTRELRVFSLGRLVLQKNHQLLITAMAQIQEKHWTLTIGGSGPEEGTLKRLAAKLGILDRVEFLGTVDPEQVVHEMQRCSFFVLPSAHESFGVSALEALACGKPIILTATGGIDVLLPDYAGLVIGQSPEEMVEALNHMLSSYIKYPAEQIRGFVERTFAPEKMCSELEQVYLQLATR